MSEDPVYDMAKELDSLRKERADGWKEAIIAWECCASIHREYAKGKDALYTTRQADFMKHAAAARAILSPSNSPRETGG